MVLVLKMRQFAVFFNIEQSILRPTSGSQFSGTKSRFKNVLNKAPLEFQI
jgi:hypothetical protein